MTGGAATAAAACQVLVDFGTPLPPAGREYLSAALDRSYHLVDLQWEGPAVRLSLAEPADPEQVRQQANRLAQLARTLTPDVRHRQLGSGVFRDNPTPTLTSRGDVTMIAPGMAALAGPFLDLTNAVDRYWRRASETLEAREEEYPALWPVDLYHRIDYFKEFPQQVLMTAPVHENFHQREAFADQYGKHQEYDTVDSSRHLAPSRAGLQSAVCDCCYFMRRDTENQADRWFTTAGRVFRNEVSPTGELDRLLSFRVRDIMAVGSESFVRGAQRHMLELAGEFLQRLDLTCRIETAGDPFFANDSVLKNLFQTASGLKYELKVRLPHSDQDLAIGSVNLHQDFFGRSLDIRLPDGSPAWSACVGVGFERAAYAICCQHGPNPANWPALDQEVFAS